MPKWVENNDLKRLFLTMFSAVCTLLLALIIYIYNADQNKLQKNHDEIIRVMEGKERERKREKAAYTADSKEKDKKISKNTWRITVLEDKLNHP